MGVRVPDPAGRCARLDEKGRVPLADYYSAKGEAPGLWTCSGLSGIDGIDIGDVVTGEQMKNLFGAGRDPVTGEPLGAAYKVYATREGAIAGVTYVLRSSSEAR